MYKTLRLPFRIAKQIYVHILKEADTGQKLAPVRLLHRGKVFRKQRRTAAESRRNKTKVAFLPCCWLGRPEAFKCARLPRRQVKTGILLTALTVEKALRLPWQANASLEQKDCKKAFYALASRLTAAARQHRGDQK